MQNDFTEVKEGQSDYIRPQVADQIKQALSQDRALALQIYAWLRIHGLKLTDY